MNDRLYRSRDERMVAGVAGGLADRLDLDPSIVRVLWVILIFISGGLFLLAYIAMAIVVPEEPMADGTRTPQAPAGSPPADGTPPAPDVVPGWGAPAAAVASSAFSAPPPPEALPPIETMPPIEGPAPPDEGSPVAEAPLWPSGPPTPAAETPTPTPPVAYAWAASERRHRSDNRGGGAIIGGIVLVLIGGFFLARTMVPQLDVGSFWPVLLIVIGIALLIGSIRTGRP